MVGRPECLKSAGRYGKKLCILCGD